MAFIDGTVVNVALPALQSSLHATVVDVQWVVESYGLFLSALLLVGGALGDIVGRRLMFLAGTGIFAAASVGCGLATNVPELLAARCVQGVGAAALVPGSLAIISACFDETSRGRAIGTWSGFTAITTALGPVLGGWLIERVSWHWIFLINVPLAAGVIAISLRHVPESRSSNAHRVDSAGAVVATISLAGLTYGFIDSANRGWNNPLVAGSLLVGFVCLILFWIIERHVAAPMVPFFLFQSSSFSGANIFTLLFYSALGIFFFLFPLDLIQIQHYSATATGAASIPLVVLMFSLSRWSGGLVARFGPRNPLIVGAVIATAGFLMFARPSIGGNYWLTFFPAFVVLGFGMTITVAPLTTVVMSSVEQNYTGIASGINNAVSRVAGVLAIAILGIVMVRAFGYELNRSLASLALSPEIAREIQANVIQLGGMQVPSALDAKTATSVRASIMNSFVYGFRSIMMFCAALALASAVIAFRMIPLRNGDEIQKSHT